MFACQHVTVSHCVQRGSNFNLNFHKKMLYKQWLFGFMKSIKYHIFVEGIYEESFLVTKNSGEVMRCTPCSCFTFYLLLLSFNNSSWYCNEMLEVSKCCIHYFHTFKINASVIEHKSNFYNQLKSCHIRKILWGWVRE